MAFGAKAILEIVTGPIARIIDKTIKDKDLAQKIKHDILTQILEHENDYLKEASAIIRTEASSESWLTRSWRPMVMIFFAILLGLYWFGLAPDYLVKNPDTVNQLFKLLQLGIGGYIVGRSVEKTARALSASGGVKKVLG